MFRHLVPSAPPQMFCAPSIECIAPGPARNVRRARACTKILVRTRKVDGPGREAAFGEGPDLDHQRLVARLQADAAASASMPVIAPVMGVNDFEGGGGRAHQIVPVAFVDSGDIASRGRTARVRDRQYGWPDSPETNRASTPTTEGTTS